MVEAGAPESCGIKQKQEQQQQEQQYLPETFPADFRGSEYLKLLKKQVSFFIICVSIPIIIVLIVQ